MDIFGSVGAKVYGRALEIIRLSPTPGRDSLEDLPAALRIVAKRPGVVGGDVARRNSVNVHTFAGPFIRQSFRDLSDGAFARGITRHRDTALKGQEGCGENDLAVSTLHHLLAAFPGEDKLGV